MPDFSPTCEASNVCRATEFPCFSPQVRSWIKVNTQSKAGKAEALLGLLVKKCRFIRAELSEVFYLHPAADNERCALVYVVRLNIQNATLAICCESARLLGNER